MSRPPVKPTPPKSWRPGETLGAILVLLIWGGLFPGIFWLLQDYFEAQAIFGDWIALIAFVVASLAWVMFTFLWIDGLGWNDKRGRD